MRIAIAGFLMMGLATGASASAEGKKITVGVKGMVCGFCAQGIERKFLDNPAVDKVDVRLGEKRVTLTLRGKQDISDETIRKVLTESGYNIDKVERN